VIDRLGINYRSSQEVIATFAAIAPHMAASQGMLPLALEADKGSSGIRPQLRRFDTLVRPRTDRRRLIALLIAGYLLVWAGFGVAAHLLDAGLHAMVPQSPWLMLNGWAIGAMVLAGAGLFQFSRLKYHCLDKCRTPYGFIVQHWHGPQPWRSAFQLGFDHGLYCVGCCWAIMLLMFVVGMGNVGWMLGLGAVMAVEKNMPWGHRLSRPLGGALLAAAVLVAGANLWS